jgi:hypothetical protein
MIAKLEFNRMRKSMGIIVIPNQKQHLTCESENALYLDIPSFPIDTLSKIILYYSIIWFDAP